MAATRAIFIPVLTAEEWEGVKTGIEVLIANISELDESIFPTSAEDACEKLLTQLQGRR